MLKKKKQLIIQALLFILTFGTTTLAGAAMRSLGAESFRDFLLTGLPYSMSFLGILTIHEFGHYYFAKRNKVDTSLPYYIPMFIPAIEFVGIGTMGAFIRMKGIIRSKRAMFDIGIAGPLAGFVAAVLLLAIGFATLPGKEYLYSIHPDYAQFGDEYEKHVYTYEYIKHRSDSLTDIRYSEYYRQYLIDKQKNPSLKPEPKEYANEFEVIASGKNLLYWIFEQLFSYQGDKIPNAYEVLHYPFLFAGYLALFFTGLNLLPIGQLDGGHVLYGLFGYKGHARIASVIFILFVFIGGLGMFKQNLLEINFFTGTAVEQLEFTVVYLAFLYVLFSRMYHSFQSRVLTAVAVFSAQLVIELLWPSVNGFHGWLVFAFLIGRILGVYHPPALDESPLDGKRKALGWLSFLIFILCFTPDVLTFVTIAK